MTADIAKLIREEGWTIENVGGTKQVRVDDGTLFPVTHPVQIHLARCRRETNPEIKYQRMRKIHDYLWPTHDFHAWTEDRFRQYCMGWNYMGWAGGASTAKSFDSAKIAIIHFFIWPRKNAVIVASTTLESLGMRVWGYVTDLVNSMAVKMPYKYLGGQSPKIVYPASGEDIRSTRHGIFARAAGQGDDDKAIANVIGIHPDDSLLIILDECSELNVAISRGFPNLDSSEKPCQVIGIANSSSRSDLHGALCTPKNGWNSIDPERDTQWATTQKNGICMFFNCYNSPAIHEPDLEKRKRLGRFLITAEQIKEKELLLGKDSDLFYRFVLGFWRTASAEQTVVSKEFLNKYNLREKAEWLGVRPLQKFAGLDPAFSTGGDRCLLRLGVMGQTIDGGIVLDYRGNDLLFEIKILARSGKSAELQIAEKVTQILVEHGVPLSSLAVDANGQGRALGGTIYLEMAKTVGNLQEPLKVYTTRGGSNVVNSFGMLIRTPLELWSDMRKFIEHNQIKGLDEVALAQLSHRKIVQDVKTLKQRLETKAEFKKRIGAAMPGLAHSPDEADSAILCLQAAMQHGFSLGQRLDVPRIESFAHEKLLEHRAQAVQMIEQREPFVLQADFSGAAIVAQKPFSY